MMRRLLVAALILAPWASAGEVCTSDVTSCSGGSGSGGVVSPVTTNPLSFTGVVTFDNAANTPVTLSDGATGTTLVGTTSTCGGGAVDAANSVCLTTNTITGEGSTADAFETLFSFGDATADQDLRCTGAASSFGCVVQSPAQAASSTAGNALAFTASPAIAGASNAGAAAGGAVSFTSGAAARNASGNADGGGFVFTPGAGIGTGVTGQFNIANAGTAGRPTLIFNGDTTSGWFARANTAWDYSASGTSRFELQATGATLASTLQYAWSSSTIGAASDAGLVRTAASIIQPTNAAAGVGWVHDVGAAAALSGAYTNATASMTNISGLTRTLLTGRKYTFDMYLRFADSTAADGATFDFDGGTVTATDFRVHCLTFDTTLLSSAQTTALATDIAIATTTGAAMIECHGSLTVNAAGTFIPRAQQTAHTAGTLTVQIGSTIHFHDVPFN
jgi:hypothetical protein